MIKSGFREKQKIHRAAHFGTTEYVININLICNGYEFDLYLIQFQLNRCMISPDLRKSRNYTEQLRKFN